MKRFAFLCLSLVLLAGTTTRGQERNDRPRFSLPVKSPEVGEDRQVTFRIRAESADDVRLASSDIPDLGFGTELKKGEDNVWSLTTKALKPGAYRYNFTVDGVRVLDSGNPQTSESNATAWSLVVVPGSEQFDTKDVPHGAVAEVIYQSKILNKPRRMHIYTPPGYETGKGEFPVFYLLHGASDSDDSWTSVGRANLILDNLIATGKAKPMIVVMPNGHTGSFSFRQRNAFRQHMEDFQKEFATDIRPYVESHYRTKDGRENRAIAGLSMGGAQTLDIAIAHLKDFAHLGVFSSGVFGIDRRGPDAPGPSWEERNEKVLKDEQLKKGLKTVWFATGKDDFLIGTSRATVKVLRDHGFEVDFKETNGGHTWLNWRDYLTEFAPLLFQ